MIDKIICAIAVMCVFLGGSAFSGCVEFGTGWTQAFVLLAIGSALLLFEKWRYGDLERIWQ